MAFRSLALAVCLTLLMTCPVVAQDMAPPDDTDAVSVALPPDVEATRPVTDKYLPPNMKTLSQLYWALGKLDINNDSAIDGYMLINECNLFNQYSGNDFEWANIRSAERKSISQKMALFSTYVELLIPIYFDVYDSKRQAFALKHDSMLTNARRFEMPPNMMAYICGSQEEIPNYPRNVIIDLNRPFTLSAIPVPAELADLYINDVQLKAAENGDPTSTAKRGAVLRLKIHVTQFIKTFPYHNEYLTSELYGRLDGIEVYADRSRLKLLYSKTFTNKMHDSVDNDLPGATHTTAPTTSDNDATGITPPDKSEEDEDQNSEDAPP